MHIYLCVYIQYRYRYTYLSIHLSIYRYTLIYLLQVGADDDRRRLERGTQRPRILRAHRRGGERANRPDVAPVSCANELCVTRHGGRGNTGRSAHQPWSKSAASHMRRTTPSASQPMSRPQMSAAEAFLDAPACRRDWSSSCEQSCGRTTCMVVCRWVHMRSTNTPS